MACYDSSPYLCTYDSGGGKDYTSLTAWETASDNDLSGYSGPVILDCYDSQTHNNYVRLDGATNTSLTAYRRVQSSDDCSVPFALKAGTGAYFNSTTGIAYVFSAYEPFAVIYNLSMTFTYANFSSLVGGGHAANGGKFVSCLAYDCVNTQSGYTANGFYISSGDGLCINCIALDNQKRGFYNYASFVVGMEGVILHCTSIGNDEGIHNVNNYDGDSWVWSCYAADNTTADFVASGNAAPSSPSGWCASKDATADEMDSTNYKNSLDLSFDADGFPTSGENLYGAGGSGSNWGRNHYDDFSATQDFFDFLKNDGAGDALSMVDGLGVSRPTPTTADVSWAIGAIEYSGGGGTILPLVMRHYRARRI